MARKLKQLPIQYRTNTLRQIDEENRTVELSFSSEEPVARGWYTEILDHTPKSVRLERLQSGTHPLLVDHNPARQIGVVEYAEIGEDRKGRAKVRFGNSDLAKEIFQDVVDGIRSLISVGYRIHKAVLEEIEGNEDTYRIMDWEPLEVSIVAIPADSTVGIGRNEEKEFPIEVIDNKPQTRGIDMPDKDKRDGKENPNPSPTPEVKVNADEIRSDALKAERKRTAEITAIGRDFNMEEAAEKAISEGVSADSFRASALDSLKARKAINSNNSKIGMSENDIERFSILRAIQSQLLKDPSVAPFEAECSRAAEKNMRRRASGIIIPTDVLLSERKFHEFLTHLPDSQKRTLTTGGTAGALVGTDHLATNFIDLLRAKVVLTRMGAMMLTGLTENVSIPRQNGAAQAGWIAEGNAVSATDPTFGNLTLSPKTVAALVLYTRQLLLQSNPSIEALVTNDVFRVLALAIDKGGIQGAGGNEPTGIVNTAGIGAVAGASFDRAASLALETDVAEAEADDLGTMYHLMKPSTRGLLKGRAMEAGYPVYLINDNHELNGYPVETSTQVPAASDIFGAFNQLIIAMWGGLDIFTNGYAYPGTGNVAIEAYQSADIGVRYPAAFSLASAID